MPNDRIRDGITKPGGLDGSELLELDDLSINIGDPNFYYTTLNEIKAFISATVCPPESQIYHIRAGGSDTDTGLCRAEGFATTNHGISVATTQSPAIDNRFTIYNPDANEENSFVLTTEWINLDLRHTNFSDGSNYLTSNTSVIINDAETLGGFVLITANGAGLKYFEANRLTGFGLTANNLMLDILGGGTFIGKIKYFNPKSDDNSIRVRDNSIGYIETDFIKRTVEVQTGSTLYLVAKNAENAIFTGGGTLYLNAQKLNGADFTGFTGTVYYFSLDNGGKIEKLSINDTLIVGGTIPDTSAQMQIDSTDAGLLPPRMTTTQLTAISSPATGLIVYDTIEDKYYYYNGTSWVILGDGGATTFLELTDTPASYTNGKGVYVTNDSLDGVKESGIKIDDASINEIRISFGTTDLSVTGDSQLDQDLRTIASPTFYSLNITDEIGADSALIGGGTRSESAQLQINSTTSGFLPPRMTTTARNLISSPATGLIVYDTTENKNYYYNGTSWVILGDGGTTLIPNKNIYYVGKHGNDSNTGKIWNTQAFLTLGQAIIAINAESPAPSIINQFTIAGKDAGIYDEQINLPAFVNIDMPNAILKSTNPTGNTLNISNAQNNVVNLHQVSANSSDAAVYCDPESTSHVFLNINYILNSGTGHGLEIVDGYTTGLINYCQKLYVGTNGEIELKINRLVGGATLIGGSTGSLTVGRLISGSIDRQTGSTVTVQVLLPSTIYDDLKIINQLTSALGIIGGTTIDSSAQFQIDSTTKGFLPSRMNTTQRNAITSPATGLHVYDTDEECLYFYNGTLWKSVCAAAQTIDTVGSSWEASSGTYSPLFTLGSGSNRLVILGIAADNTSPNASWSDIKYAGVSMRHIPGAYLSWGNNSMDFYFMLEVDLIGINDTIPQAVTVTFINTPAVSNIGFVFGTYKNVHQTDPFYTIHTAADMSTNPLSVNIQNCSIDDHVIGLGFDDFDTGTFAVTTPFVEHPRATFTTARLAFADRTASTTTTTCTYTSSSGPGIGIIGFGLYGIGKYGNDLLNTYHEYYMTGNTTETSISALSTPVKVNGTTTEGLKLIIVKNNNHFTHTNNRLTYNGTISNTFELTAQLSWVMVGSTAQETLKCYFYLYDDSASSGAIIGKTTMTGRGDNDGDAPFIISIQCLTEIDENDYIEVWVSQESGSVRNILVNDLNVIVKKIN